MRWSNPAAAPTGRWPPSATTWPAWSRWRDDRDHAGCPRTAADLAHGGWRGAGVRIAVGGRGPSGPVLPGGRGEPGRAAPSPLQRSLDRPGTGLVGFVFNVVGAGSGWLAARNARDRIDLLGPLGRGFAIEGGRPAVCVAGGLGIAVFIGLSGALAARGRPTTILYGARSADQLLPAARFSEARIQVATDDGSAGHH